MYRVIVSLSIFGLFLCGSYCNAQSSKREEVGMKVDIKRAQYQSEQAYKMAENTKRTGQANQHWNKQQFAAIWNAIPKPTPAPPPPQVPQIGVGEPAHAATEKSLGNAQPAAATPENSSTPSDPAHSQRMIEIYALAEQNKTAEAITALEKELTLTTLDSVQRADLYRYLTSLLLHTQQTDKAGTTIQLAVTNAKQAYEQKLPGSCEALWEALETSAFQYGASQPAQIALYEQMETIGRTCPTPEGVPPNVSTFLIRAQNYLGLAYWGRDAKVAATYLESALRGLNLRAIVGDPRKEWAEGEIANISANLFRLNLATETAVQARQIFDDFQRRYSKQCEKIPQCSIRWALEELKLLALEKRDAEVVEKLDLILAKTKAGEVYPLLLAELNQVIRPNNAYLFANALSKLEKLAVQQTAMDFGWLSATVSSALFAKGDFAQAKATINSGNKIVKKFDSADESYFSNRIYLELSSAYSEPANEQVLLLTPIIESINAKLPSAVNQKPYLVQQLLQINNHLASSFATLNRCPAVFSSIERTQALMLDVDRATLLSNGVVDSLLYPLVVAAGCSTLKAQSDELRTKFNDYLATLKSLALDTNSNVISQNFAFTQALAFAYWRQKAIEPAKIAFEERLALAANFPGVNGRPAGQNWENISALLDAGNFYAQQSQPEKALRLYEKAVPILKALENEASLNPQWHAARLVDAYSQMGYFAQQAKQSSVVGDYWRQSFELAEKALEKFGAQDIAFDAGFWAVQQQLTYGDQYRSAVEIADDPKAEKVLARMQRYAVQRSNASNSFEAEQLLPTMLWRKTFLLESQGKLDEAIAAALESWKLTQVLPEQHPGLTPRLPVGTNLRALEAASRLEALYGSKRDFNESYQWALKAIPIAMAFSKHPNYNAEWALLQAAWQIDSASAGLYLVDFSQARALVDRFWLEIVPLLSQDWAKEQATQIALRLLKSAVFSAQKMPPAMLKADIARTRALFQDNRKFFTSTCPLARAIAGHDLNLAKEVFRVSLDTTASDACEAEIQFLFFNDPKHRERLFEKLQNGQFSQWLATEAEVAEKREELVFDLVLDNIPSGNLESIERWTKLLTSDSAFEKNNFALLKESTRLARGLKVALAGNDQLEKELNNLSVYDRAYMGRTFLYAFSLVRDAASEIEANLLTQNGKVFFDVLRDTFSRKDFGLVDFSNLERKYTDLNLEHDLFETAINRFKPLDKLINADEFTLRSALASSADGQNMVGVFKVLSSCFGLQLNCKPESMAPPPASNSPEDHLISEAIFLISITQFKKSENYSVIEALIREKLRFLDRETYAPEYEQQLQADLAWALANQGKTSVAVLDRLINLTDAENDQAAIWKAFWAQVTKATLLTDRSAREKAICVAYAYMEQHQLRCVASQKETTDLLHKILKTSSIAACKGAEPLIWPQSELTTRLVSGTNIVDGGWDCPEPSAQTLVP